MVNCSTTWATLEQWSPMAFLAAGGLFALAALAMGLNAVAGTEIAVTPAVIYVILLVVFVGLLGLYPRLAEQDSTVARGGVGFLAVTVAIILSTFGVSVLPIELPFGEAAVLAIVISVAVGFMLTVAAFGIASLRTGTHPRPVGGSLLAMATGISFIVIAMLVYGHSTPEWVGIVVNGFVAASLGSIGSVLQTADVPTESVDTTDDATAN